MKNLEKWLLFKFHSKSIFQLWFKMTVNKFFEGHFIRFVRPFFCRTYIYNSLSKENGYSEMRPIIRLIYYMFRVKNMKIMMFISNNMYSRCTFLRLLIYWNRVIWNFFCHFLKSIFQLIFWTCSIFFFLDLWIINKSKSPQST